MRVKTQNEEYSYPTASNAMRELLEPNTLTYPTDISDQRRPVQNYQVNTYP